MRPRLFALALVATLTTPIAAMAADPAFVGSWGENAADCKTPFRFTAKTYTPPGNKTVRIQSVEKDGNAYLLSFADGYRVALFDVKRQSLTWHSPISGDTFDLVRCR